MITKEMLDQANSGIPTVDIKGKNYVMVNDRIKRFRDICPNGGIATEIVNLENGICTIKAVVTDDDGKVLATGLAQEKENSGFINKTSYIENCETSAIGRALGFCGIGVDDSIGSAQEVANAIKNQNGVNDNMDNQVSQVEAKTIRDMCLAAGKDEKSMCEYFKIARIEAMNKKQYAEAFGLLNKVLSKNSGKEIQA